MATVLLFDASFPYLGTNFAVSVAGNSLPFRALADHTNYVQCAVDISGFSGQTAEIRFTAYPFPIPLPAINNVYLDEIRFSSSPPPPPEFSYVINNNSTVTITGYNGPGGAVVIPSAILGLPVTSIGTNAFFYCMNVTSVTIPNTVTTIEDRAFMQCYRLTSVTIPSSVVSIGDFAFVVCALTSVTIPDGVSRIGRSAFAGCLSLTSVTIGSTVTRIGNAAFAGCVYLGEIHFRGNAPGLDGSDVFADDEWTTVYYLPGTTGWGPTFGNLPTALWVLPNPVILTTSPNFGMQTNGFGFIASWATNLYVVVEACTNLAGPAWVPVGTNTLTGGASYFSDPEWTNCPGRFYRLRWP